METTQEITVLEHRNRNHVCVHYVKYYFLQKHVNTINRARRFYIYYLSLQVFFIDVAVVFFEMALIK